ncbi:MAG: indole-3-glycerol phosphate synthase TrpC [Verrucomicrobiia bacterium]
MTILEKIVAVKRREMIALRSQAEELRGSAAARTDFRDFAGALRRDKGMALIAEVKKASPSAGVIRSDFNPVRIARECEKAGAAAISILTDREFFQGRIEFLQQIRASVKLPLLRKDFVIEELQVYEAAACGADAILLIVAILDDAQLKAYCALAEHLHLAALVEVHDGHELDRALAAGAGIIGINNRDLRDFSVRLATTEKLAAIVRQGACADRLIVAESGINARVDVERVAKAGVNAILIGESLMRSRDIGAKIKELLQK